MKKPWTKNTKERDKERSEALVLLWTEWKIMEFMKQYNDEEISIKDLNLYDFWRFIQKQKDDLWVEFVK